MHERVVINLSHSRYTVLESLSKKQFNFRVSNSKTDEKWDIYWSDVVSKFRLFSFHGVSLWPKIDQISVIFQ
jgi:hypothetical protein